MLVSGLYWYICLCDTSVPNSTIGDAEIILHKHVQSIIPFPIMDLKVMDLKDHSLEMLKKSIYCFIFATTLWKAYCLLQEDIHFLLHHDSLVEWRCSQFVRGWTGRNVTKQVSHGVIFHISVWRQVIIIKWQYEVFATKLLKTIVTYYYLLIFKTKYKLENQIYRPFGIS